MVGGDDNCCVAVVAPAFCWDYGVRITATRITSLCALVPRAETSLDIDVRQAGSFMEESWWTYQTDVAIAVLGSIG
eukprot:1678259-Pyramimonas_sp.AAC.1